MISTLNIKNKEVLVPTEFFSLVSSYRWYLDKDGYVVTKGKNKPTQRISTLILGKRPGMEIDHINGDRLDNRLENLRHVTHQQNCLNRKLGRPHFDKDRGKWKARVKINQKEVFLGRFSTFAEALVVLKEVQKKYFGKYNYQLNQPI